ncbi:hypothetical protein HHB90_11140 [Neisseria meningitidis]|nr:hypothetical protein [Neisseria meningitidis]
MAFVKSLLFALVALVAVAIAVEDVKRDERGVYSGYGYAAGLGYNYGNLGYSGLGYTAGIPAYNTHHYAHTAYSGYNYPYSFGAYGAYPYAHYVH